MPEAGLLDVSKNKNPVKFTVALACGVLPDVDADAVRDNVEIIGRPRVKPSRFPVNVDPPGHLENENARVVGKGLPEPAKLPPAKSEPW